MEMGSLHGFQLLDFSHYNKPSNPLTHLTASQQTSLLAPLSGGLTVLPSGTHRDESVASSGAEGHEQHGTSVAVSSAAGLQLPQSQLHPQLVSPASGVGGLHRQTSQSSLDTAALSTHQRQQSQHTLHQQTNPNGGARKFECSVCHKSFKQLAHLNTHALLHEGKRPHKCSYCEQTFSQLTHLKRHLVTHRSHCADEPLRSASTYSCHLCPRRFAFPSDLNAHLNKHYNRKQRKPSSNRGPGGGSHTRAGIGPVSNTQSIGAVSNTSSILVNQKTSLPGVAGYACGMCPRAFQYPSQLREHMYVHTHIRRFPCGECGRRFMKEHHLKVHQQSTHLCLRPHTCPICHKTFSIKANLERHLFVHSGHKTFECPVCSKRFAQPQTLKMHLVSHNDVKPFQCTICGKGLARAHNLRAHMAIHRQNKPYSCDRCSATFTLKGNLQRHHKEKHQNVFDATGNSTVTAAPDAESGRGDEHGMGRRDSEQMDAVATARSAHIEQMISVDEEVSQSDEGAAASDFDRAESPLNHTSVYSTVQQRQLGSSGNRVQDEGQEEVDDGNDNDGRQSEDSLESEIDPVFDEDPEPTANGELAASQDGSSQNGLGNLGPSGTNSSTQQQAQSHQQQQQQQQPQQQTLFQPYASCTSSIQQQSAPPASPELFHPHHHVPPLPASVFSQTINHQHHHVPSMPMAVPPVHPFYHPHPHHPHHPTHPGHPGQAPGGPPGVSELSLGHAGSLQLLHDTAAAVAASTAAPCTPVVVQHNVPSIGSDLGARLQAIHAALDELVQQSVVGVSMGATTAVASEKITAIHMAVDELVTQGPQMGAPHTVGHGQPGGPCHPAHSLAVAVPSHPTHLTHSHGHHGHHHGHNGGGPGPGHMLDLRSAGAPVALEHHM